MGDLFLRGSSGLGIDGAHSKPASAQYQPENHGNQGEAASALHLPAPLAVQL